jgi:hypothetical protein
VNGKRNTSVIDRKFLAKLDHSSFDVANTVLSSTAQNQNESSWLSHVYMNKGRQEVFLIRAKLLETARKRIEKDQAQNAIIIV